MSVKSAFAIFAATLLVALASCTSRSPAPIPGEPVRPLHAETWREIKEEIWTASAAAQVEAESGARTAMREWMKRVHKETESEFVPWYTDYWTQQWIGIKAGWYEMNREDGDVPVEEYLTEYLLQRYYELVLEPAGQDGDPKTITEMATAQFVRLLSDQLQCLPQAHSVPLRSLQRDLQRIPLITLSANPNDTVPLSVLLEHNDLVGVSAYDALITHANSVKDREDSSLENTRLRGVVGHTVARLVAELPLRAGSNAAGLVLGEALGLFVAAGVTIWSAASYEQDRPEIEARLREALEDGLDQTWQILTEDPKLGVLYPVNHMRKQVEDGLFPPHDSDPGLPFF